jgi:hypothetical protein
VEWGADESVPTCQKLLETIGAALYTGPGRSVSFEGAASNISLIVEVPALFPCRKTESEVNIDVMAILKLKR